MSSERRECFGVVVEVARILAGVNSQVCLVGGWAVYILTELFGRGQFLPYHLRHRGSMDVDIAVGWPEMGEEIAEAIAEGLRRAGYEGPKGFQWLREVRPGVSYRLDMMVVPPAGHDEGTVVVGEYHFAPLWDGDVLWQRRRKVVLKGTEPSGKVGKAEIAVPSAGAMVVAKSGSLSTSSRREPERDAYDIFLLLRTYPGGPEEFVRELAGLPADGVKHAIDVIKELFADSDEGAQMAARVCAQLGGPEERYLAEIQVTARRFMRAWERLGGQSR